MTNRDTHDEPHWHRRVNATGIEATKRIALAVCQAIEQNRPLTAAIADVLAEYEEFRRLAR